MICKKCKTAVDDKDTVCKNCGAPLNKHNEKWKIAAGVLVAGALIAVIGLTGGRRGGGAGDPEGEVLEKPGDSEFLEPDPLPSDEPLVIATPTPEPSEAPIPTSDADLEKPLEEVWEIVDTMVIGVNEYYDNYSDTVTFLSKNGYFYDNPAKAYVVSEDMEGLVEIDEKYFGESTIFFYLRPNDLAEYPYLRVSNSTDLTLFAALETKDGFAIAGKSEQGGVITREDLKALLDKYSWDHGPIQKISFQSDEFEQIIRTIAAYTGITSGFDVRYMYRDNRYICVVASPKDQPMQISQFILEDTGDVYNMKLGNIEAFDNHRKTINDYMPDFNQSLLPIYDLGTNLKYLASDFNNIIEAMLSAGFITESDKPLNFASGTSDFVYFEFDSGKHFVGYIENDTWKMYPVADDETAKNLMWSINKKAPVFIIKQY